MNGFLPSWSDETWLLRQVPLYRTFVITNCSKVFCQVHILCTFVILLFGELRENMNLVWQLTCVITNLKHLTLQNLSWNDAMWLVNSFFAEDLKSQMGHLNGLVPSSWTNAMCLVKWLFCEHLKSQMEHLNGLSPSWIDAIFLVKFPFSEKL